MKQELVDLSLFLSKKKPSGIIAVSEIMNLFEEFSQSKECTRDFIDKEVLKDKIEDYSLDKTVQGIFEDGVKLAEAYFTAR